MHGACMCSSVRSLIYFIFYLCMFMCACLHSCTHMHDSCAKTRIYLVHELICIPHHNRSSARPVPAGRRAPSRRGGAPASPCCGRAARRGWRAPPTWPSPSASWRGGRRCWRGPACCGPPTTSPCWAACGPSCRCGARRRWHLGGAPPQ